MGLLTLKAINIVKSPTGMSRLWSRLNEQVFEADSKNYESKGGYPALPMR